MIRSKKDKPASRIEIDITGPDGNAFALMKHAQVLGIKLGYSEQRIAAIRKVMMMGDYECLLHTFEREFGHIVTIWR